MRIAINGFGRIGRAAFKIFLERIDQGQNIEIVAINDLTPVESFEYLLKYDSVYGRYEKDVSVSGGNLVVDGKEYKYISVKEPNELPWAELNVDIVVECTGFYTKSESAKKHIEAGAKKVLLSAPADDDGFITKVLGVENLAAEKEDLVSNASCTTNCVTPVMRVLSSEFGVEKALLNTVHAYTSTQAIVDRPDPKDYRRGRAAAHNIVPSSTGAAKTTGKAMPEVAGIFDGIALRVPVICGSISDVTAVLKRDVTVEEVNDAFKSAQDTEELKGILKYSEDALVSSDIIKTPYSAIIDGPMTTVVGGNLVKVLAWYDNEWGYSNRLVDMAVKLGS